MRIRMVRSMNLCVRGYASAHVPAYTALMNQFFADRVAQIRASSGLDQTQFGEIFGVGQSSVVRWEQGSIPKGDRLNRIADYAGITVDELLGREPRHSNILEGAVPAVGIPLLGDVPGGPWREAIQKSRQFIPAPQPGMPTSAYALKVRGDSMDKLAKDGATIIIDPTDFDLFERRLFVVRNVDGEVTFKQYLEKPARLVPCSKNPEHKPIPVTEKGYEVVGRVIKIILDPDQAALD